MTVASLIGGKRLRRKTTMAPPAPTFDDRLFRDLLAEVRRRAPHYAPEWTDPNVSDPGVALLELLAYVLTDLTERQQEIDTHGRALARRVARLADSFAASVGTGDCPPGPRRINYFAGGLLAVEDLAAEQDYIRHRFLRRNRALHGAGVVSGLDVTLERAGGRARVVIAPGLAFDARGEEIEVGAPTTLPLPARGKSLLVLLRYAEQPCRPVPALVPAPADSQADGQEPMRFSRIAETFTATLASSAAGAAVPLARLRFSRAGWALDRKFRVARVV